jgi:predicted RNA-binding protein YlxR (DUF448 family)
MIKPKKTPQRLCSGCQAFHDKKAMTRVVRKPEGEVALDPTGKAAGRGGYVCKSADCIQRAKTGKGLDRALKTAVPSNIYELLLTQIEPS